MWIIIISCSHLFIIFIKILIVQSIISKTSPHSIKLITFLFLLSTPQLNLLSHHFWICCFSYYISVKIIMFLFFYLNFIAITASISCTTQVLIITFYLFIILTLSSLPSILSKLLLIIFIITWLMAIISFFFYYSILSSISSIILAF